MTYSHWTRCAIIITAGALLTACGDDDPVDPGASGDFDPSETADQILDVLDPLLDSENAILGVNGAAQALAQFSESPALTALEIQPPLLRAERLPYDAGRLLREARPRRTESLPVAQVVFPTEVVGQTLVWDPAENQYAVDPEREDAPSNGVRVIYYAMNPVSGLPTEPVDELGFIDLTDEDQAEEERLGIRVVDTSGGEDTDLLDYYVGFSGDVGGTQGEYTSAAVGFLSTGSETLDFDLEEHFAWDEEAGTGEVGLLYVYQLEDASIGLQMDATGGPEPGDFSTFVLAVDISDGQDHVDFDIDIGEDESVTGEIYLNETLVMEVSGEDGAPVFTRPDGSDLTQQEVNALLSVWSGAAIALDVARWLMGPVGFLLLPG